MNSTTATGPDYSENASASAHPAPLVAVNGTKWLLDGVVFEGSLTPRTMASRLRDPGGPYSFAGLPPLFAPAILDGMLKDSLRNNYQLQVHVFGTPAAEAMLDAMERTGGARVWSARRLRFEHGDGLTPDLAARVKALGVIVSQQGSHLDILGIDPALGPGFLERLRADHAQPLRSLLAADIPLALGSDGPLNPWLSILGATTDPDRPDEAITREQAITAYTMGSAYAEFAEHDKGSLTPGKFADIAVLSQDVFTVAPPDLLKTRSLLTLVAGEIAYDDHVLGRP